jgi:hypothetical protein
MKDEETILDEATDNLKTEKSIADEYTVLKTVVLSIMA